MSTTAQHTPEEGNNHTKRSYQTRKQSFDGVRVTTHSTHAFSAIMSRIYSELGSSSTIQNLGIVQSIKSYDVASRDAFTETINEAVGPRGFMLFQEIDHAPWLSLFLSTPNTTVTVPGLKRLILGNPLIAQTMLRHDFTAGLFVPVELLVREVVVSEGGGTDLMYVLPSSLIAGIYDGKDEKKELLKAVEVLDEKFKALVDFVAFEGA